MLSHHGQLDAGHGDSVALDHLHRLALAGLGRLNAEEPRLLLLVSADIQRRSWPQKLGPNLRSNGFQVSSSITCPPRP